MRRLLLPALGLIVLLASCRSLPEHTRFIPKDAMLVVGLHTGEMSKELAWSAITGSNLLEEMRKAAGGKMPEMLKDAENAGIDYGSTIYVYSKPDNRFSGKQRMAAVLPVSDAKKLDAYIRKHATGATVRTLKDRSEVMIDGKAYLGWNEEVLIAMNTIVRVEGSEAVADTAVAMEPQDENGSRNPGAASPPMPGMGQGAIIKETVDSTATAVEMDAAFNMAKDASLAGNGRFKELENAGHDITFWLSQDAVMDAYGAEGVLPGLAMANSLWKGSAMATGFDFEKGRVDGSMRFYVSDSMRSIAQEFGKENIDAEMLKRLPAGGLNLAAGYHLSPKAVKMILDKMGVTGMANLALMQKGLSIDDILGAFTGDMVVSINNFRMESKLEEIDSVTQKEFGLTPRTLTNPEMDFVYAMKIGDKAKLTRLMGLLSGSEFLRSTAPNVYALSSKPDGPTMIIGDQHLVIARQPAGAQNFLNGAPAAMPEAAKKVIDGHPAGFWADVQSFMKAARLTEGSRSDSAALQAVQNMFTTVTGHGGEFRGSASEYHMSLGFVNKKENSLVQLLHLAQQLAALNNKDVVARR